jgi:hypothetical protein
LWNKWTGDVRIEKSANQVILVNNINTLKAKYENGTLVQDETKVNGLLEKGKALWINDSYWLVMPWKLQDPGVNLTYVKTEQLSNGTTADILQLTFNVTPENKYWLYVERRPLNKAVGVLSKF